MQATTLTLLSTTRFNHRSYVQVQTLYFSAGDSPMKIITSIIRHNRNQDVTTKVSVGNNQCQCNYANNYYGDQVCLPRVAIKRE